MLVLILFREFGFVLIVVVVVGWVGLVFAVEIGMMKVIE